MRKLAWGGLLLLIGIVAPNAHADTYYLSLTVTTPELGLGLSNDFVELNTVDIDTTTDSLTLDFPEDKASENLLTNITQGTLLPTVFLEDFASDQNLISTDEFTNTLVTGLSQNTQNPEAREDVLTLGYQSMTETAITPEPSATPVVLLLVFFALAFKRYAGQGCARQSR
jgi:hypothetical protein